MQTRSFPLLVLIISLAQGCSFSTGSKSSADSSTDSSGSSASIFSSPSSSKDEEKYQLEVMNYTSVYITSSVFDHFAFIRGITEIASENGITDWEDDEITLIGIGRGLKNSSISRNLYESYKKSIALSNSHRMQMIQKGYDMH